MNNDEKVTIIEDRANHIGFYYLQPYRNKLSFAFEAGPNGRISGVITGDKSVIRQAMADLATNKLVPALDLITAITLVRTEIYNAKIKHQRERGR